MWIYFQRNFYKNSQEWFSGEIVRPYILQRGSDFIYCFLKHPECFICRGTHIFIKTSLTKERSLVPLSNLGEKKNQQIKESTSYCQKKEIRMEDDNRVY